MYFTIFPHNKIIGLFLQIPPNTPLPVAACATAPVRTEHWCHWYTSGTIGGIDKFTDCNIFCNISVQLNYRIIFVDASEYPSTSGSMSKGAGLDGTFISVVYKWDNRRNWQFHLVPCILEYCRTIKLSDYFRTCPWCPCTGGSTFNGAAPDGTLISVIYKWDNRRNWEFHLLQCILNYFRTIKSLHCVCRCLWVPLCWWQHVQWRRSRRNIDCRDIQVGK